MRFFAVFLSALALVVSTIAASANEHEPIVIKIPITQPARAEIWPIGSKQSVCWDTSLIQSTAGHSTGTILLGHRIKGSYSGLLNTTHPIAEGFLLTAKCTQVTVPDVEPGDSYFIDLHGNKDYISFLFHIVVLPKRK